MKLEETKNAVSKPEKKKDNKDHKEKKGFSLGSWFDAHKAEFRKIVWPTRKEVAKETVVVLLMCFVMGAIIFGMDWVLNYGYNTLITLVSQA